MRNQVIVGNIGTVYEGDIHFTAKGAYYEYVRLSGLQTGRASGEDVTWLIGGEIHKEHTGRNSLADVEENPTHPFCEKKVTVKLIGKGVLGKDLQLRDVVRMSSDAYSFGTVVQINEDSGEITIARPYISTSDFSVASNRVLRYIGLEEFFVYPETKLILVDRPNDRNALK